MTSLLLLVFPAFLLLCGFGLPPQYEETFLGELKEKCQRLHLTPGKRIVLVGGSGVAFGYDSRLLKKYFTEYEIVNFGMYAGLGTKVMLELSREDIREGDLVILSPEQDAQTLSNYFNGEFMWKAADGSWELLAKLDREELAQMAGNFPSFAEEKLRYFRKGKKPETDDIYCRNSFNEYGDVQSELCGCNKMPGGVDSNIPISFSEEMLQDAFAQELNTYAQALEEKGAALWYRLCPVNALAVQNPAGIESWYDMLQEKLDFPVIGNPYNSIMEAGWFYDTNFHLNSSGKMVNTVQLIRDIKAMQGDDRAVEEELPQMPELDGARDRTEILKKEVYRENQEIESVAIPSTVKMIEDYAFEGCEHLRAIILEEEDPSQILVGQHLLDGTSADVYVPEKSLTKYRLNYSWAVYSQRIKPLSALKN